VTLCEALRVRLILQGPHNRQRTLIEKGARKSVSNAMLLLLKHEPLAEIA
jgi:hypothetical protein